MHSHSHSNKHEGAHMRAHTLMHKLNIITCVQCKGGLMSKGMRCSDHKWAMGRAEIVWGSRDASSCAGCRPFGPSHSQPLLARMCMTSGRFFKAHPWKTPRPPRGHHIKEQAGALAKAVATARTKRKIRKLKWRASSNH